MVSWGGSREFKEHGRPPLLHDVVGDFEVCFAGEGAEGEDVVGGCEEGVGGGGGEGVLVWEEGGGEGEVGVQGTGTVLWSVDWWC